MAADVTALATTRAALIRSDNEPDALGDEIEDNAPLVIYTPWVETRRNLVLDPRAVGVVPGGYEVGGASGGVLSHPVDPELGPIARMTRGSTGALRIGVRATVQRAQVHTFAATLRASRAMTINVRLRPSTAAATNEVAVGSVDLLAGIATRIEFSATALNVSYSSTSGGIALVTSSGIGGDTLDVALADLETGLGPLGPYFDGDQSDTNTTRSTWLGVENGSISRLEQREITADWSDFPASIIERDVTEFDQASNTWRSVRRLRARVPGNLPVAYGDRIRDNRDGEVYAIDSIRRAPRSLAGRSYTTLMLRRSAP